MFLATVLTFSVVFQFGAPLADAQNADVTRGEFITELMHTMGVDVASYQGNDTDSFSDVTEELAPYVEAAERLEITTGMREGFFGANEKVTREQAYVFLIRALNLSKTYDQKLLDTYKDKGAVWGKQELAAAIQLGLLKGFEDKTLRPKQPLKKDQMKQILERYHSNFERITFVHSNDLHGRILHNEQNGELGLAKIAHIANETRKQYANTFVLDMGDTFHGTNYANFSQGESAAQAMNLIGYDAMVAGNHDFNFGYKRLVELDQMTDFPILSANVVFEADGELLLYTHMVQEKLGKKIAFVGLTAIDTVVKTHPNNIEGLVFIDEVEVIKEMVAGLKNEVDHIVVLSHSGYDVDLEIAKAVTDLDLILGGHSHTTIEKPELVNGTYITQAWEHGKALGITHMLFYKGELVGINGHLTRDYKELPADPKVKALLDQYVAEVDKELNKVIGSVNVKLDGARELVRTQETNLGNLVTDAMRELTGADIAMTNGGGIRADIEPGEVTMNHVISAFPFTNTVVLVELNGQQILSTLEHSVRLYPEQNGGFMHVSGLTFEFDPSKAAGDRVSNVKVDGKPLDLNKKYTVATNDFTAAGGDGYSWLAEGELLSYTGELLNTVVSDYIQDKKAIPAVEGRIKVKE